jgi:hypothetical protein
LLLLDLPSEFAFEPEQIFGHGRPCRTQLVHQLDDFEVNLMKVVGLAFSLLDEKV